MREYYSDEVSNHDKRQLEEFRQFLGRRGAITPGEHDTFLLALFLSSRRRGHIEGSALCAKCEAEIQKDLSAVSPLADAVFGKQDEPEAPDAR